MGAIIGQWNPRATIGFLSIQTILPSQGTMETVKPRDVHTEITVEISEI